MSADRHKQEVGARLDLAIQALGLTQAAVARKFEVAPSRLGNWIRGDNYPDEWFLKQFCDRYNITTDWIYRGVVSSAMAGPVADALFAASAASSEASPEPARRGPGRPRQLKA